MTCQSLTFLMWRPKSLGTSPVVQCLRLCASRPGNMGSIPGRETKIPHVTLPKESKVLAKVWKTWGGRVSDTQNLISWYPQPLPFFHSLAKVSPGCSFMPTMHSALILQGLSFNSLGMLLTQKLSADLLSPLGNSTLIFWYLPPAYIFSRLFSTDLLHSGLFVVCLCCSHWKIRTISHLAIAACPVFEIVHDAY